jgi:hypothetical protein
MLTTRPPKQLSHLTTNSKEIVLHYTKGIHGPHMRPIKMFPRLKNQQTGILHISTVRHFHTPAVHKHYNRTKHSCNKEQAWVLLKHSTSIHIALTFLAQCIIMNDLYISWDYGY